MALLLFQVPLHALIIWAGGAEGGEVLRGSASAAGIMLLSGRPYGLWLDLGGAGSALARVGRGR